MTVLLSLLFAAPASADTITPVRDCGHGDGYRELDGDSSAVATSPEGYLIVSYCVDSRGRKGGSEVRTLSTPQRTAVVWHSGGRPLAGYSVEYARVVDASDEPDADNDTDTDEHPQDDRDDGNDWDDRDKGDRDDRDERDEGRKPDKADETAEAEAHQSTPAESKKTDAAKRGEQSERTPSASASPATPAPGRQTPKDISEQSEESSQMTRLNDGEELRVTSLDEDDDEDGLRSLVVAAGIIIVGLLAGMIALLVRLPGQR
ncbi:hypothetical protein GCM10007979_03960 [Nocardioides albus]|nr:hypothetical protein GCM10007979_03960 [Nocardioides albus]